MRAVEVSVTAEHITHGRKRSCRSCPVALAISDAVPQATVIEVGACDASFFLAGDEDWTVPELPIEAQDFIKAFDDGQSVRPFAFTMQIPDTETAA